MPVFRRSLIVAVSLSLAAVGLAGAQAGGRQHVELTFDEHRPGRVTALRLAIDYVNPSDPSAKPPAVERVVETLAAGARIDTSVPQRCLAADSELVARGAAACPAGSRVGGGELDVDTGVPGPGRLIQSRVTQFNNTGEIILLLEQDGGARFVSRVKVEGGTTIAETPPLPGGPPDGFTAIKRVRLHLDSLSVGGRGYVTTPASCPPQGKWENRVTLTYRDGRSYTESDSSPCTPPPAAGRGDRSAPLIRVTGVPRRCASRAFTARVRIRDDSALRRVRVRIASRVLRTTRRNRFDVRIAVGTLRGGRHRLSIAARDRAGNLSRRSVAFTRCSRTTRLGPAPGRHRA